MVTNYGKGKFTSEIYLHLSLFSCTSQFKFFFTCFVAVTIVQLFPVQLFPSPIILQDTITVPSITYQYLNMKLTRIVSC